MRLMTKLETWKLFFYDLIFIIIYFSISNLVHTYRVWILFGLIIHIGPVIIVTGPVTSNANPVLVYIYPVPTNLVGYRII